jgi:plasmid stabilization system protein ParE
MGVIVRFDPGALSDLSEIRTYLVPLSPSGAERVRRHILATIDSLTDFPALGRPTDDPACVSWR